MKIVYLKLLELLAEVPEILWKDKDKGQLELSDERPAIAFPCALIKIELPRCEDMGGNMQQCICGFTIRLVFNFQGNTSGNTPEAALEQSLGYYDIAEKVYKKLQGFTNDELSRFSRKRVYEEVRGDGLTVLAMAFETDFIDRTVL